MKTFGFDSNSSARASFNASLTVYSFTPLSFAYVRFCTMAETRGEDWKALLEATAGLVDERRRDAGRKSRNILGVYCRSRKGMEEKERSEVCVAMELD